jgi:hypothetical protein
MSNALTLASLLLTGLVVLDDVLDIVIPRADAASGRKLSTN